MDEREMERVFQLRAEEKARLQETNADLASRIDGEGKIRVWDFQQGKYVKLWPIDAKEQIGRNSAALHVIDMLDPGGHACKVDLLREAEMRSQGYRLPGESPTAMEQCAPEPAKERLSLEEPTDSTSVTKPRKKT